MPLNTIIKVHNFCVTQKIKLQIFRSNNLNTIIKGKKNHKIETIIMCTTNIYRVEFKLHLV